MNRSSFKRSLLLTALVFFCATVALAQGRGPSGRGQGGPGPEGHGRPPHAFLPPPGLLDLNDTQKDATRAILDQLRQDSQALRETQRTLRQQLRDLTEDPAADPAAIGRLVQQLHAHRGQLKAMAQEAEADFVAVLDANQKAKYDVFRELREERRQHRRDRFEDAEDEG